MTFKIALILKEHFREKIKSYLPNKPEDVVLDFFSYDTIGDIRDVFLSIHNQYDGFYVSGPIAVQAIQSLGEEGRDAVAAFSPPALENVYQTLLRHITTVGVEHVDLSRVGMDFLNGDTGLDELIREGTFAQAAYSYEKHWRSLKTVEENEEEELRVQEAYVKQYREGRIDLIITYYYSVLDRMKEYGIPCYYVYPSEGEFWNCIHDLKNSISLKKAHKNRSAVIHISTEKARELYSDEYELHRLDLVRAVIQFNQTHFNKAIFKANYDDLELYTDSGTLEQMTGGFRFCPLLPLLRETLHFPGTIGYGIGDNLYQARLNAVNAGRFGKSRKERQEGSYLLDQNETLQFLTGSTGEKSSMLHSIQADSISEIADKVHLSSETILRIAEMMNSLGRNEITSQDLMSSLGISLRSANKFLSCLEKGGCAAVCGQQRNGVKGRPINIYRVSF